MGPGQCSSGLSFQFPISNLAFAPNEFEFDAPGLSVRIQELTNGYLHLWISALLLSLFWCAAVVFILNVL